MPDPDWRTEGMRAQQAGELSLATECYQRALAIDPTAAEIWFRLGSVNLATKDFPAAIQSLQHATQLAPKSSESWSNLGVAYATTNRLSEAEHAFGTAATLDPSNVNKWLNWGRALLEDQKLDAASEKFERALSLHPNQPTALLSLAIIYNTLQRYEEAYAFACLCKSLDPQQPQAHALVDHLASHVWDQVASEANHARDRDTAFKTDSSTDPLEPPPSASGSGANKDETSLKERSAACIAIALQAIRRGADAEARLALQQAVEWRPDSLFALYNLAVVLSRLQQTKDAIAVFERCLALRPDLFDAQFQLGLLYANAGDDFRGEQCLTKAIQLHPDHAPSHLNLGNLFHRAGKIDEAISSYQTAIRLKNDFAIAHLNLGNVYYDRRELNLAEQCYLQAIEIDPKLSQAHVHLGQLYLQIGQWRQGWEQFEWRTHSLLDFPRLRSIPRWNGESLEGKKILLVSEQGLGDTIQFLRFAHRLKQRGAHVLFDCRPGFEPLIASSGCIDEIVSMQAPLPVVDYYCPLMSLPFMLGKLDDRAANTIPYLAPTAASIQKWRLYFEGEQRLKVGLVWRGNPLHAREQERCLPLAQLAPLITRDDVRWISLQKGDVQTELAAFAGTSNCVDLGNHVDSPDAVLMETAAIMRSTDLVISIDSAPAHLAGALGVPVWIPLMYRPDWRWMLDRDDTPWYPSARLFRQHQPRDWSQVIERMNIAIDEYQSVPRRFGR